VKPARRLTREFLNMGEKRDDVVLGPLLDFQNLLGLQLASGRRRTFSAVPAGTRPAASMASQAANSTRSQVS